MNLVLKAYYDLLDDMQGHKEWTNKLEEELGQQIAFLAISIDESVRDDIVANSPYFARFVNINIKTQLIGLRETEVLQMRQFQRVSNSVTSALPLFNSLTINSNLKFCLNKVHKDLEQNLSLSLN